MVKHAKEQFFIMTSTVCKPLCKIFNSQLSISMEIYSCSGNINFHKVDIIQMRFNLHIYCQFLNMYVKCGMGVVNQTYFSLNGVKTRQHVLLLAFLDLQVQKRFISKPFRTEGKEENLLFFCIIKFNILSTCLLSISRSNDLLIGCRYSGL